MVKKAALLLAAAAAGWALTAWPLINLVETGRTPEYPDLVPREYRQGVAPVAKAAKDVVSRLPRWTLVGTAQGPRGSAIQAVAATRILRLEQAVTIRIRKEKGVTRVSVRSESRLLKWDFGQNARNIRELLAALDEELQR